MTGTLIGRHAELQRAVDALKRSRTGEATTLVVRGEAGIGKSRFLDEVLAQAELLGHTVRDGRLGELDRYVPFAAFVLALGPVLADERDPDLWATTEALADGLAGGDLPLARLVDEVERLLRGWAGRNPVVLAVDDLHAADVDTLAVLSQLVRRLRDDPVTFVATMRAHAPDVGPDLAATVERLGRDGLAVVIDLDPLDADDVRGLIRTTVDATPDEHLVDLLWEATRGSPFYVVEGLRSLGGLRRAGAGGRPLPAAAVGRRGPRRPQRPEHHPLPPLRARPRRPGGGPAATCLRRVALDDLGLLAALTDLAPGRCRSRLRRPRRRPPPASGRRRQLRVRPPDRAPHPLRGSRAGRAPAHARRHRRRAPGRPQAGPARTGHRPGHPRRRLGLAGDATAVAVLVEAAESVGTTAPASAAAWYDRALALLDPGDDRPGRSGRIRPRPGSWPLNPPPRSTRPRPRSTGCPAGHLRSRTAGLLVTALTALGRLPEALAAADRILAESDEPLPRLHAERGSLLVQLDRFAEAEDEARRALELAGDDDGARALAYRALASLAHERGDVASCTRAPPGPARAGRAPRARAPGSAP